MGRLPKNVRMDGAGENKKFKRLAKQKWPTVDFEMTAANAPEQNGKVERAITTMWS